MPLILKRNLYYFASLIAFISLLHMSLGYQFKIIYIVSAAAMFVFLSLLHRYAYSVSLTFYMLIGTFYAPIGVTYGFPDINSVGSLIYTNTNESIEFIKGLPNISYLYIGLLILSYFFALKLQLNCRKKIRYWAFFIFFIPAFWSPIKNYVAAEFDNISLLFSSRLPEFRFFIDCYENYRDVMENNLHYAQVIQIEDEWKPEVIKTPYDTYILVIGESVRKDFMSSYGFKYINNTPWMNKSNGVLFQDIISVSGSTQLSLINSLALKEGNKNNLNNSLITLTNKAEFETYWISNQGIRGEFDSPIALMGKQARHSTFLKDNNSEDKLYLPDENLLPYIEQALASNTKKLIIIHLMGSHPQPCVRTNNQFDTKVGSDSISCYVQSIKNTDSLLATIAEKASSHNLKWAMIYFADHGLSFVDKNSSSANLTHSDKYKQNFQIPFFMTSFDAVTRDVINERRSNLSLLPFLSHWLGINDSKLSYQCDWLAKKDCNGQDKVISFKNQLIEFNSLPEDNIEIGNY